MRTARTPRTGQLNLAPRRPTKALGVEMAAEIARRGVTIETQRSVIVSQAKEIRELRAVIDGLRQGPRG